MPLTDLNKAPSDIANAAMDRLREIEKEREAREARDHIPGLAIEKDFAKRLDEAINNPATQLRQNTHGDWRFNATVSQDLKKTFWGHCTKPLRPGQAEALDLIFTKLGRIAAGDANFKDHWDDIAGYAILASKDLDRPA